MRSTLTLVLRCVACKHEQETVTACDGYPPACPKCFAPMVAKAAKNG